MAASVPDDEGVGILLYPVGDSESPDPRRLAGGFEASAGLAWSPDGSALAFAARRANNWDIFRVNRDGSGLVRLTSHPAYDAWPAWSPDGLDLVFASYRDGDSAIYRIPNQADGDAAAVRLAESDGPLTEPAWSPDGRWIVFAAWHAGAYRLEAVAPTESPDGTPRVVAEPADGVDLRAPAFAPDGSQLAYREDAYGLGRLVTLPWSSADGAAAGGPAESGDGAAGELSGSDDAAVGELSGSDDAAVGELSGSDDAAVDEPPESNDAAVATVATDPAAAATGVTPGPATSTIAQRVSAFGWYPAVAGGQSALVVLTADRNARRLIVHDAGGYGQTDVANLPASAGQVSWSAGPMPSALVAVHPPLLAVSPVQAVGDSSLRPGLSQVDVNVPGARINSALAEDYAALRADVRAAVGRDFLGTLSDMWRPLSFYSSASAFFSWHKTGRAFDTQMELRGPGGRRDSVVVREEVGGGTQWRMYLRAGAQDGSVGRPLVEPGWSFAAGSGDPELTAAGGKRGAGVPAGYWVDFTSMAERYGWRRISSLNRPGLDWHQDWEAIEYWHYERRDGLRWFDAALQVYTDAELAAELHPDKLSKLHIAVARLGRLGFPVVWPPEG